MYRLVTSKTGYRIGTKFFSTTNINSNNYSCKLLVVGGGSGGCATAAKFARDFKDKKQVILIEPQDVHYYQPMFTLIGGGIKKLPDAGKPMSKVLPKNATWLKDEVVEFNPSQNSVQTKNGDVVNYDFLLIACGINPVYEKIPGLLEALDIPNGKVCSNYHPKYVNRTFEAIKNFKAGDAVFTFPNSPVKCPGAPQKICYIAEDHLRKFSKRNNANVTYNTSLGVIFGVKKYADALWKVCKQRNINVNLRTNLKEVKPENDTAVFENLDAPGQEFSVKYSLLHVTPPMSTSEPIRNNKELSNEAGFVEVNKDTLQHVRFSNVFAIGDCANTPNSKTAAAVAAQSPVVHKNLTAVMSGKTLNATYDGYASCPLVTGYGKCILAEFDYNLNPLETFPFSQDKERYSMYVLKKDFMPELYWYLMLNGYWNGPALMRNLMHLGLK